MAEYSYHKTRAVCPPAIGGAPPVCEVEESDALLKNTAIRDRIGCRVDLPDVQGTRFELNPCACLSCLAAFAAEECFYPAKSEQPIPWRPDLRPGKMA